MSVMMLALPWNRNRIKKFSMVSTPPRYINSIGADIIGLNYAILWRRFIGRILSRRFPQKCLAFRFTLAGLRSIAVSFGGDDLNDDAVAGESVISFDVVGKPLDESKSAAGRT
jgi:hypothetical protein